MSQQTHTVALRATDGISTVFQKAAQSASASATAIGAAGQKAAAGINQQDAAATKAAASATKLGTASVGAARGVSAIAGAAQGAAFATFLGFLGDASRAAAEDEAAFVRLESAVSATGASYATFAQGIEQRIAASQRLGFADDATADALATLTTQTQDAAKAQELLSTAQDVARARNISLGAAASLVGRVASGNTGILARYGIVIDEGATATEALGQLQQRFGGQAAAFATTQAGAIARMQENIDNLVESIGGSLGPMQSMLALLPGISAGMSLAGGAAGALSKNFGELAKSQGLLTSLAGSINPVAIALGAAAAAGVILIHNLQEQEAANAAAEGSYRTLAEAIGQVADAQARGNLRGGTVFQSTETQGAEGFFRNLGATIAGTSQNFDDYTISGTEAARANELIGETALLAGDNVLAYSATVLALRQAVDDEKGTADQAISVLESLRALYADTGVGAERAREVGDRLVQSWRDGNLELDALAPALATVASDTSAYADAALGAASATDALTGAWSRNLGVMESQGNRFLAQAQAVKDATAFLASGAGGPEDLGFNAVVPDRQDFGETTRLRQLAEAEEEVARETEDAAREAERHAQELETERAAALDTANALIGSIDEREQATQRAADAQEQYATRTADINESLAEQLSNLNESYADQTEAIAERRVDIEESAAERMQDINESRIDAAVAAEEALVEVSKARAEVVSNAAEQAQRAEQQWMQTSAQNLDQQAEIRQRLQETTAEAAERWHDLNQQNLEQQREIRTELQATISEIQSQLHEAQAEAQRDLQRLAQDHRRTMQEFRLDESRIREDLALVLADPRATAEQKNAAELAARRQLEDLDARRKDEDLAHDRAKEDIQRRLADAEAQAAQAAADARAQARADYQQLAEERAAAQEQYREQVSSANEQASEQIANLEEQRQAAFAAYQQQQADAAEQVADQLADLQEREDDILETRAEKYAEIEEQRRKLQEDTADQLAGLAKDAADAEEGYTESVAKAQAQAAEDRQNAFDTFAESSKTELTELQRLRDEGLITEGEYQTAYDNLIQLQEDSKHLEDLRLIAAIDELPHRQALVDAEVARLEAAEKYHELEARTSTAKPAPTQGNRQQAPGITRLTVDDEEFDRVMTESEQRVEDFGTSEHITTLAADWTPFARVFGDATSALHTFDTATSTTTLDADDGPFLQVGQDAHQRGLNFSTTTYTAELDGDDDPFRQAVADADSYGQGWQNTTYEASLDAEYGGISGAIVGASKQADVWDKAVFTATLTADRTELDRIVAAVRKEFDGKSVATTYLDIVARVKDTTTKGTSSTGNTRTQRALGGMAGLRTLVGEVGSELAISSGRVWEVGASGPEWIDLASGTLIVPHGAAAARGRASGLSMQLGGHATDSAPQMPLERNLRGSGASTINNYGTITIKVDNADVGAEIARQLSGQAR